MGSVLCFSPRPVKNKSELAPLSWTPQKGDNSPEEVSDGETTAIHQRVQAGSPPTLEVLRSSCGRGGPRTRLAPEPSVQVAARSGDLRRGVVSGQRRPGPQH